MHIRSTCLACSALLAGLGALVIAGASASCASNPTIQVDLTDPGGLGALATYGRKTRRHRWSAGGEQLAYGKVQGARHLQTIGAGESFVEVGDLPKDKFGFAALLRKDDCAVVGFGCTPVDFSRHRRVTIQIDPVTPPAGACNTGEGETCVDGLCKGAVPGQDSAPPTDAGDAAVATSCTLTMVSGAGQDLPASSIANANVAGPVAVATSTGFVISYLEWNADTTTMVRLPLDDTGKASTKVAQVLAQCPGSAPVASLTSSWNNAASSGFAAMSWDDCADAGANLLVTGFDGTGTAVGAPYFKPLPDFTRFQAVNGATPNPSDTSYLVATIQRDQNQGSIFVPAFYSWDGTNAGSPPGSMPSFNSAAKFVRVTEASNVLGIFTDQGGTSQFLVGAPYGASLLPESMPGGTNAAMASWGNRALAAVATSSQLSWMVRTADGNKVQEGTVAGAFLSVGAASLHDHFILVGAQSKALKLFRFDNASGAIAATPALSPVTGTQLGNTSLQLLDGTMVSVAAARKRLLVSWLNTAGPLGEGKSPGGYALFDCDG